MGQRTGTLDEQPSVTFDDTYRGKRVLVTGHTGFKGGWLTAWLRQLGAEVMGVSKDVPTKPSMFVELALEKQVEHVVADVRDLETIKRLIAEFHPDFVFHLAAQSLVSVSYAEPLETVSTNVMGTANVLEALRSLDQPCVAVLVTSDKCYDNVEWVWGYRETDRLGGKDVYSASKGAAELVIRSYVHSFLQNDHPVRIAVGRAGNVIGGGDWARDRLVVDCVRAWSEGRSVEIRSPNATRPWQHVLEPLSGYLALGSAAVQRPLLQGEAFNFGPHAEQSRTVVELLSDLSRQWGFTNIDDAFRITANIPFHEAGLLRLNCDKAVYHLKWESNLEYSECVRFVGAWYTGFYRDRADMFALTNEQIAAYERLGAERGRVWAR